MLVLRNIVNKMNVILFIGYFIIKIWSNPELDILINQLFLLFLIAEMTFLWKDKQRIQKGELLLLNGPEIAVFGKIQKYIWLLPLLAIGYHLYFTDLQVFWAEVILDAILPIYFGFFGVQLMSKKVDAENFYYGQFLEKTIALNKIQSFELENNSLIINSENNRITVRPFFAPAYNQLYNWIDEKGFRQIKFHYA